MCVIFAVVVHPYANQAIYDALTVIQHRGQDAAGILTCDGTRVHLRKDKGLVRDVFQQRHMEQLVGTIGIGHVRYPTAGSDSKAEAQPFYVNSPFGLALAHNGNLTNALTLRESLVKEGAIFRTTSDTETIVQLIAKSRRDRIVDKLIDALFQIQGGYSLVIMTNKKMIGVRAVSYTHLTLPTNREV